MDFSRVSIYYLASDGGDWALYLQNKLNTPEYSLDTVLNDLMCDSSFHVKSAKLNIFVITPHFLDSYVYFRYLEKFERRNSIVVLTGIEYTELESEANSRDCEYIMDWIIHQLGGNEESVRDLMIKIIEVYEGHVDMRSHVEGSDGSDRVASDYDQLPCLNRQVNKVLDVVQKGDLVYVLLERTPEAPVHVQFSGQILVPECLSKASVFTFDCHDIDSVNFSVVSDGIKISQGTLLDRRESQVYCALSTPYADVTTQTDACPEPTTTTDKGADVSEQAGEYPETSVNFRKRDSNEDENDEESENNESHDTRIKSASEYSGCSKLEIINQILEEEACPENVLCRALGIEHDLTALDAKLAGMIEGVGALRKLADPTETHNIDDSDKTSWPSLLHFGAQYNLKQFCTVLTSNRLVHRACTVPNKHGLMPHELAQKYGHTELAHMLANLTTAEAYKKDGKYDSGFDTESYRSSKYSGSESEDCAPPVPPNHPTEGWHGYANPPDINTDLAADVIEEEKAFPSHQPLSHSLTEPRYFKPAPSPTETVSPTTKQQKKGGFFKMFSHNKKPSRGRPRRFSEPSLPSDVIAQLNRSQEEVIHKKKITYYHKEQSPAPEPAPPMCVGLRPKQPGSAKGESIQKRKSIRLANVMTDTRLKGPKLPPRNKGNQDKPLDQMFF